MLRLGYVRGEDGARTLLKVSPQHSLGVDKLTFNVNNKG